MFICKYCSKAFSRPSGITLHEKSCRSNPDRVSGQNQYSKGAVCSDATRRKMSEAGRGRSPSLVTRDKISKARIKYLKANPDQVPYLLNHYSKGESFPETYWREILEANGIVFEQEKRVSIYRLDFSVNDVLDLEIDGEQHYSDPRILASNQRRDEELRALGWKIIRVRWSNFQRMSDENRKTYVKMILNQCLAVTVNQ